VNAFDFLCLAVALVAIGVAGVQGERRNQLAEAHRDLLRQHAAVKDILRRHPVRRRLPARDPQAPITRPQPACRQPTEQLDLVGVAPFEDPPPLDRSYALDTPPVRALDVTWGWQVPTVSATTGHVPTIPIERGAA
jgi:hypothetical protein